jgi:DNA repair protein RadD
MEALRNYQTEAVESAYRWLREGKGNPLIVLPTAAGKSWVMAQVIADAVQLWGGRVMLLAHVKELLLQNLDKIQRLAPGLDVGIYSAGLDSRDTANAVVVGGIQGVYDKAELFGHRDLVIVDECHLIPRHDDSMYVRLLCDLETINPNMRTIGLTATPYRLDSGMVYSPEGPIFTDVCHEVSVSELMAQGYLCRLTAKAGQDVFDTETIGVKQGEFAGDSLIVQADAIVSSAVQEIIAKTASRQGTLVFCCNAAHAQSVADCFQANGVSCGLILGTTPTDERADILDRFQRRELRYLANVNVLTTGFDAPHVDCVALLRPTLSPGLYYQMVGRGFRLCEGKDNCLVLDYGGNVLRHGPINNLRIKRPGKGERDLTYLPPTAKECEHCKALVAVGYAQCPECGELFKTQEVKHYATADDRELLNDGKPETIEVSRVAYHKHYKRSSPDASAPCTMRVEYWYGIVDKVCEWVCFEHSGFAFHKALAWWKRFAGDLPAPEDVDDALAMIADTPIVKPAFIIVQQKEGDKWPRVIDYLDENKETIQAKEKPVKTIEDDPALLRF